MTDTTFDEARRCPRCEELGLLGKSTGRRDGSRIHTVTCKNDRCKWYDTSWVVQVMADGSVAKPEKHDKFFPAIPDRTAEVQAALDRELQRQMPKNN